jgi:hypothetical protein
MSSSVTIPRAGGNLADVTWLDDLPADPAAAALVYHAHGWHPVVLGGVRDEHSTCRKGAACPRPGKHPLGSNWTRPLRDAAAVRDAFAAHPGANVGLLTGHGFWVLDVDGDEGVASLAALEAQHGPLPITLCIRTGAGGWHLYFRTPGGPPLPRRTQLAPGLTSHAYGDYVVAPPSVHATCERHGPGPRASRTDAPA